MRLLTLLLVLIGAVGCDDAKDTQAATSAADTDTDTDADSDTDTDTDSDTDTDTTAVTWHGDVRPALESWCTRCHFDGGQGPGDFTDVDATIELLPAMIAAMEGGRMPPPSADPDCRDYLGSAQLNPPDDAVDLLLAWQAAGTPVGVETAYTAPDAPETELADPDLVLTIQAPYVPSFTNPYEPGNEYRCFVLDPGHTEDFYITALAPQVDAAAIVHHTVLFTRSRADLSWVGADGYDCFDEAGAVTDMVHGWAPGGLPLEMPEGSGIRVGADEVLVLQMHYFASTESVTDQSGYAFRTAPMVDDELQMYPWGPYEFWIPAGDDDYSASFGLSIPVDITIYAVFPHMHRLGWAYHLWAETSFNDECLVQSDAYDFDNQLTYTLVEPYELGAGERLTMECTWNNSTSNPDLIYDPPIDVGWGERTDQEMCFSFILTSAIF